MKFIIKATYRDGDSFNTYTDQEILDYEWQDEKVVIKNMQAIKEHYEAYRSENDRWYTREGTSDFTNKWWYAKPLYSKTEKIDAGLNLSLDDGTLVYYHCPWCGYFASLQDITMSIKEYKIEI